MQRKLQYFGSARSMLVPVMRVGSPVFAPDWDDIGGSGTQDGGGQQADSDQQQNNDGNAGGQQRTDSAGKDNAGKDFDPEGFWKDPEPDPAKKGAGEELSPQEQEARRTGQGIIDEMRAVTFNPVMNQELAAELAEGKFENFNKAIHQELGNVLQQAVITVAKLMKANNNSLESRFESIVGKKFDGRDNSETLESNFPMARDPAMRPVIQGVFDQSMKLHNNDRKKAVETTRNMLRHMGKHAQQDLGIPPQTSSDDYGGSAESSTSLVAELLSRR